MKNGTRAEWFWAKVQKTETCWLWTASRTKDGYGLFRTAKGLQRAHVVAWELTNGPIPTGLEPDHVCRVRHCVRPELPHLELVTHRINVLRGVGACAQNARKTHCKRGHSLSGDNLKTDGAGRRQCWRCLREIHGTNRNKRKRQLRKAVQANG